MLLGHGEEPGADHQLLINLADDVPLFFSRFDRVAEIINDDPAILHQGRQRYSSYRNDEYPLHYHEINP